MFGDMKDNNDVYVQVVYLKKNIVNRLWDHISDNVYEKVGGKIMDHLWDNFYNDNIIRNQVHHFKVSVKDQVFSDVVADIKN